MATVVNRLVNLVKKIRCTVVPKKSFYIEALEYKRKISEYIHEEFIKFEESYPNKKRQRSYIVLERTMCLKTER